METLWSLHQTFENITSCSLHSVSSKALDSCDSTDQRQSHRLRGINRPATSEQDGSASSGAYMPPSHKRPPFWTLLPLIFLWLVQCRDVFPELYPCLQCASWHCSLTDSDDVIVAVDLLSNKYHKSILACFSYLRTPKKWINCKTEISLLQLQNLCQDCER